MLDIQNQFVRLKVYSQRAMRGGYGGDKPTSHTTPSTGEWVFINYPISIGKKHKKILQSGEWDILSPTLVKKRRGGKTEWYLHIPLEKKVDVLPIEKQKKENPNLTTMSVDMGMFLKSSASTTIRGGI